jgi:hypothetical protein
MYTLTWRIKATLGAGTGEVIFEGFLDDDTK